MGLFGRMLGGAAFGGAMGAMSDEGSFLGGAAGGAAAAGPGLWAARKFGGGFMRSRGINSISGAMRGGLGRLGGLSQRMANKGFGMLGEGGLRSNLGVGMAWAGQYGAAGAGAASRFIGSNAAAVNKWGGRALAGMGVASGAYIGSSILSSNRGY